MDELMATIVKDLDESMQEDSVTSTSLDTIGNVVNYYLPWQISDVIALIADGGYYMLDNKPEEGKATATVIRNTILKAMTTEVAGRLEAQGYGVSD